MTNGMFYSQRLNGSGVYQPGLPLSTQNNAIAGLPASQPIHGLVDLIHLKGFDDRLDVMPGREIQHSGNGVRAAYRGG